MVNLLAPVVLAASLAASLSTAYSDGNSTNPRALSDLHDGEVCGLDIKGYDVGNLKKTNPDWCMYECQKMVGEGNTNAVTWTKHEGGTCWCKKIDVKNLTKYLTVNPSAVSYAAAQVPAGRAERKYWGWAGWDFVGNDVGNVPVPLRGSTPAVDRCAEKCIAYEKCFAFTITDYNGGTCWMKSKTGTVVGKMNTISSYVVRTAIANTCRP